MKSKLLNFLVCPFCKSSLKIIIKSKFNEEIIEGELICKCGRVFPITKGIPRMLDFDKKQNEKTKKSFTYEWNFYKFDKKQTGYNRKAFFENCGKKENYFNNKLILDAGCGVGRTLDAIKHFKSEIVAMDLSNIIEKVPEFIGNPKNVYFIQGDIMYPPFKPKTFDFVYSFGVLHHTPNTKKAFKSIVSLVKNKGDIIISVYQKMNKYFAFISNNLRKIITKLPHNILYYLCYILVYFVPLGYKLIGYKRSSLRPLTKKETFWLVFDWFSPQYQWHHSQEELIKWFKENNFYNPKISNKSFFYSTKK